MRSDDLELAKRVVDAVWDARAAALLEQKEPTVVLLRQDVEALLRRFVREDGTLAGPRTTLYIGRLNPDTRHVKAIFGIPVRVQPGQITAVVVQ